MILGNDSRWEATRRQPTVAVLDRIRRERGTGTFVLDALDAELVSELIAGGICTSKELPLLACLGADGDWFTITTERIDVAREGCIASIALGEVGELEPAELTNEERGAGRPEEYRYIGLVTCSGERHVLRTDPGLPFYGVYNMILWLAASRRELRLQNAG